MKALVLAAGKGKRLEEITLTKNKCMIEYNGKPILENMISNLCKFDLIQEIVLVVGYRAEDIINYFGNSYENKRITYVIQRELKGLVNAIEVAREFIGDDDFLLALGDEIMLNDRIGQILSEFQEKDLYALLGAIEVQNRDLIKKTYTFIHDDKRQVYRLIEKPLKPLNNLMGTGIVVFKNDVFNYIEQTPVHPERGEKELPGLIQILIDNGYKVGYFNVCDGFVNINTFEDFSKIKQFEAVAATKDC